ncbi:NAD-dependent epimerase/dehydratase family protein [Brucella intermedia]|uniref:NAD-dependent epimerase/dehydratase family protein n=2 Tax=Brucella TaxID=234 RepID=A0A7H0NWS9_9HYPH|nr:MULTISPECIES: NAD-dependent epimerase/dehydratase family protein [Brucella/Ochrobactrum group]PJT23594.1 UDP-glucose 4-epimerase [Ochrobactrum sp. 30A/1000/2015]PJT38104.1 UDP-glucose 4-epimerase [Ochrobactrum sp. 27A/999/2015]PJT41635.1 UDP-glucose 4-epimerase [Ochrobactrum sp. 23A/997/2015]MCH6204190.1 NAD-dependent epimerase/dehydratase family protein [Brucella ciceri]MDL2203660.1 NAD-dependent epimerase/dehydratase family protein [Brucella intermedia]
MRIAVTGAGGFIGSALTQMLAGEGHEVLPLSRNALSGPDLSGVETVVHCAALAHRTGAERPDAATFDAVNHRLAVELAARAKAAGVKRFVFVSTIYTVAGNPSPLTPDMPLKPRDDYGRAKARAETDLRELSGIEIVIARPVLVYGPRARANLKALIRLCDSGLPLPFGLANNRRSFVSLENVARALTFLSVAPAQKVAGRVFHLAEPQPRSTKELVTKLRAALGKPSRLVPVPPVVMRLLLSAAGKSGLYDQLYGDLVADTSSLIEAGFDYLPGDRQLEAMAQAV